MTRLGFCGVVLNIMALVAIVTAFVMERDTVIEGAYFNRTAGGEDAFVVSSGAGTEPYLILAALFVLCGTALLVLEVRRRPGGA
jgi:hypothetical protein